MATPLTIPSIPIHALETVRIWTLHLLCLVLPLTCIAFGLTAPHPWWGTLPFVAVLTASIVADMRSPAERRQPDVTMPGWPFDGVLYVLVAAQLLSVALVVHMIAVAGFWRIDTLVGILLAGVNSGYSAIVVAHELIHRKEKHFQWLGRLLLATALYDHFAIEHVRGHHARVGTSEDPATARFGETALQFLRRTVPAQWKSAWKLEMRRLGDESMTWSDRRMLSNRMLHGIVAEWSVPLVLALVLGAGPAVVYVLQAALAVRLLEAVNYFEHYGLQRSGRRVGATDSWDTDSWFTLYTLVGLSRHADHHANASRPYQQLRYFDDSPKLRYGYFATVCWLMFLNASFRADMAGRLEEHRLGPYAESAREARAA
ncbi:MAG TPA: alkane 1-monooxygenase [Candidatus Binatia bacterium]|jgi:alkane 1-monooxygenase